MAKASPGPGPAEWLAALGWVVLGVVVLAATAGLRMSTQYGPGPRFFSVALSIPLLLLAGVRLLTLWRESRRGAPAAPMAPGTGRTALQLALLASVIFAYSFLLDPLGFLVASALMISAVLVILGRDWRRAPFEAVVAAGVLFFGFTELLGVQLPGAGLVSLRALGL